MTEPLILIDEPQPHVRRLTFNRPAKRNAISPQLRHDLLAALRDADADASVHVAIMRGAGVCFSAGYDVKSGVSDPTLDANPDGLLDSWAAIATRSWMSIAEMDLPVIAQIHGMALAGAVELAAACDLMYVALEARIGHPVAPLFGPPDYNFSPWLVGPRHSMEMMLTGDLMDGAEAVRIGLANRAWPEVELDDAVLAVAGRIAKSPREVSRANKRTVRAGMDSMGVGDTVQAMVRHREDANTLPAVSGVGASVFDSVRTSVAGNAVTPVDQPSTRSSLDTATPDDQA